MASAWAIVAGAPAAAWVPEVGAPAPAEPAERPKIGLALGGGGAKGGAHVGVLKVLEELNVPVDYIAGTSIGAIIGGLYATGLTGDELAEALANIDWNEALRDKPPRRDLSFRRKEEDARYLFDLEVGVGKGGLRWPSGLISGQNLFFLLQSLTIPVAEITDFDRLPIPFRAVATDVNLGKQVVLDSGYLASALRASMAIPGVFAPVSLDGRLLVDGGLVNNLPVDVVREMGADIVIAVDLGAGLETREVGRSMVQIYQQTMRMLTRPNVEPSLEDADLVINPGVSGFGTMDFGKIVDIMSQGEEMARAFKDHLEPLAVDGETYRKHREAQLLEPGDQLEVDFVDFVGNERVDDRIVENQIRLEAGASLSLRAVGEDLGRLLGGGRQRRSGLRQTLESGEPIDLDSLSADLQRLYGLGEFEQVDFAVEERRGEEKTEEGIVIRMREKPWGPNYLHFGMEILTNEDGDLNLRLLLNLTKTQLNARAGEWRTDLILGSNRSLFTELYQPLDFRLKFFVAPRASLENLRSRLFVAGEPVADLRTRQSTAGLDFGYQFNIYGELRIGLERAVADISREAGGLPGLGVDLGSFDLGGVRLLARTDRLDNVNIPRKGGRAELEIYRSERQLGAERDYTKMSWTGSHVFSRDRHTILLAGEAGWSPGSELPLYDEFTLGGFGSLSGFIEDELRGQYLGVARGGYYYALARKWFLGGFMEAGNVWRTSDEIEFSSLILAGTLILAKETALGPFYLAYGVADGGKSKVYLVIGRTL